jgi:hypothetical protein
LCIGARGPSGETCGWCTGDLKYDAGTVKSKYHCAGKDSGSSAAKWTCTGHFQTTSCDEAGDCGLDGIYRGLRIDNNYEFGEWSAVFTKAGDHDDAVIKSFGIDGKVSATLEGQVQCVKKCDQGTTTSGVPFTFTTKAGDIRHGICGYTEEVQAETTGLMWSLSNTGVATPPSDFDTAMLNTDATVHTYYRCSPYKSVCKFAAP